MPTARERWKARLPAWTLRFGLVATVIWVIADHLRTRVRAARIQASHDRQRQEGLRAHFSSTLSDVSFTVYSLLPTLFDQIATKLDVEHAFAQLRDRSSQKGASITDSQQLSAVSDDTASQSQSSAAHPGSSTATTSKTGSPEAGRPGQQQALPESWASEFVAQGGGSEGSQAMHHVRAEDGAAASTDAESMAVSSPSQTLSLSIDSHSPPSGASSSHSPPLLQSPSVSPRSRYATLAHADSAAQQAATPGPSKSKLWNEVKAGAITRAVLAIHVVPLVVLHTTSQLCMMARKQYLRDQQRAAQEMETREPAAAGKWYLPWHYFSVSGMGLAEVDGKAEVAEEVEPAGDDGELDRTFLCSSWWLLHVGWRMIEDKVHAAVQQECHDLKLKQSMSIDDWRALFTRLRARIAVTLDQPGQPSLLQDALIPPLDSDRFHALLSSYPSVAPQCPLPSAPHDPALLALLDEMSAQFRSPDYPFVLARSMDLLQEDLCAALADEALGGAVEGSPATARLAAALPSVASWSRDLGNGYPEKALDRLLASGDVAAYAALVYGDFGRGRIA